MDIKNLFKRLAIIIEKYPIELFILEIVSIMLFIHSIKLLLLLLSGSTLTGLLAEFMKFFFKESRPRPALERNFYKQTFRLNKRSFPSAHSAIAAFFPALLIGNIMFLPTLLFAIIIDYSRVYIKSHYPIDVIGGSLIGVLIGILIDISLKII